MSRRRLPELEIGAEMSVGLFHIGEVADRIGLSLNTIRHYDQAGLVVPSARSQGGFRLYSEQNIAALLVIKRMKPLGFSLDEMGELLNTLHDLERAGPAVGRDERDRLLRRLVEFDSAAQLRCGHLREQLAMAEEYAGNIRERLHRAQEAELDNDQLRTLTQP